MAPSLFRLAATVSSLAALGLAADPFSDYILTPRSRTLAPVSVYNATGTVSSADALTGAGNGTAQFGNAAFVTYDFGKNIAGIVSFTTGSVSGSDEIIGISFTESSLWISSEGSDATADSGIDKSLWFIVSSNQTYSADKAHQRGGFRYLNVYHNTSGSVDMTNLTIYYTPLPTVAEADLGSYSGYFHSSDEKLNRVWYAGVYSCEINTIDPTTGNSLAHSGASPWEWWLNYTITNGSSAVVDGAKRDRLVWPGDMVITVPSIAVSTYDMESLKNNLDSLFILQESSGLLPYSGVPFNTMTKAYNSSSFTYHLHNMISLDRYFMWSGNTTYLLEKWDQYKLGLSWALTFVDTTGMVNIPSTANLDWLRFYLGGHNIEANAILYHVLNRAIVLAAALNDTTANTTAWAATAETIKRVSNQNLWDASASLYRDNDTAPLTTLHPQDGNVWAIIANLTESPEQAANISAALAARWGTYGAPAPEAGATVSPFISGFEIEAHYLVGRGDRAVELMRTMWADFMLDDPRMTNSTFIEGYSTDGSLVYAPYSDDARISHAHGWSAGPTAVLTQYTAGLQITGPSGSQWRLQPSLSGGLTDAQAGFRTNAGDFSAHVVLVNSTTGALMITLSTPTGTTGSLSVELPSLGGGKMTLVSTAEVKTVKLPAKQRDGERFVVDGLAGGSYTILVEGDSISRCQSDH